MTPLDLIRGYALALRDLAEQIDAQDITVTLASGAELSWSSDDGFHLLTDGETLDITEWVDHTGLLPADGVTSVTQQPELLVKAARP